MEINIHIYPTVGAVCNCTPTVGAVCNRTGFKCKINSIIYYIYRNAGMKKFPATYSHRLKELIIYGQPDI